MANDLHEPERLSREPGGARGALDDRLGIACIVLRDRPAGSAHSSERAVAGEEPGIATLVESLVSCGADEMPHPGGTLTAASPTPISASRKDRSKIGSPAPCSFRRCRCGGTSPN